MEIIDNFNKNTKDVDDQFEDLIPSDMPLQDLEGGMEEDALGLGDGAEVEAAEVEAVKMNSPYT